MYQLSLCSGEMSDDGKDRPRSWDCKGQVVSSRSARTPGWLPKVGMYGNERMRRQQCTAVTTVLYIRFSMKVFSDSDAN